MARCLFVKNERRLQPCAERDQMSIRTVTFSAALTLMLALAAQLAVAQQRRGPRPFSCTIPASQRTQETGCYVLATELLKSLPAGSVFWHLYTYPTLQAARRAKGTSTGTVVKSLGKVWLFRIAPPNWRPAGGQRVAIIGPLPHFAANEFVARYLEGVEPPGGHTPVHRHPGVEAWYVLSGEQCMETPGKTTVVHAGGSAIVPAGVPMVLRHTGVGDEREITLVLHDASKPWMTKVYDWKPAGKCPQ